LPKEIRSIAPGKREDKIEGIVSLNKLEEKAMRETITATGGNVSQASKTLGIGRATFYRKAKKFGII
jgi:transcriptional regulator of acetoin/glycerol metabolism